MLFIAALWVTAILVYLRTREKAPQIPEPIYKVGDVIDVPEGNYLSEGKYEVTEVAEKPFIIGGGYAGMIGSGINSNAVRLELVDGI
jgi:hypothetical protein